MKLMCIGAVFFTAILAVSCASRQAAINNNLSPAELIQRGQEASDRNRFSAALQYYAAVIERFPLDIDSILAAEYETAFIHYKQKKYDIAKIEFNNILERYNIPDEALLPQSFKILSRMMLNRISEIENRRSKRTGQIQT